jgi:opacity protein-like surface antigen
MRLRLLVCTLVLTAASAFAADVDGKWSGTFDMPTGALPVNCNLKAEGSTLTGTISGIDGSDVKITDGKVDGNRFSFTATVEINGMPFSLHYTGVVSGTDLTLTAEFAGMPFQIALKKAA